MPHKKNKWIIVFLIYADFRIDPEFDSGARALEMIEDMKVELNVMFEDIITVPMNNEAADLYVILSGINYVDNQNGVSVTETKTLLYKIRNDKKPFNRIDYCHIIQTTRSQTGEGLIGLISHSSQKLGEVFSEIKYEEDDDEIFLITWDHGSAFGIFGEMKPVESPTPIQSDLNSFPYLKMFWDSANEKEEFKAFMEKQMKKPALPLV